MSIFFHLSSPNNYGNYAGFFEYQRLSLEIIRGYNLTTGSPWVQGGFQTVVLLATIAYTIVMAMFRMRSTDGRDAAWIATLGVCSILVTKSAMLRGEAPCPQIVPPIACGSLGTGAALALALLLFVAGIAVPLALLPAAFAISVALYIAATTAYSVYVKRCAILDVIRPGTKPRFSARVSEPRLAADPASYYVACVIALILLLAL